VLTVEFHVRARFETDNYSNWRGKEP